ncbi:MAG: UvrB/UvrC motif-containing protein [Candidatus Omnitrophota bacterium]|jgi:protein arginine kinase activator
MICSICNSQEAMIHLTEIVNDQMIEIHLCETCAAEKGTDFKTHFNAADLLSGLIDTGKPAKPSTRRLVLKCPSCGLTYEEFGKTGRLGCAQCYDAFSKMLLPLIKRVQRATRHLGKKPSRAPGQSAPPPYDLKILRDQLRKCVQSEEFEEAAHYRDEIKRILEEKSKKGKKGKNE